jgi:hypothetical protein
MTATVHPIRPNSRTHERLRRRRKEAKDRLVVRIGIDPDDAPLFDEELRMMAYEESLKPR